MAEQSNTLQIDEHGLTDLTQQMIRTPSVSLEEEEVARLLAQRMEEIGFQDVGVDRLFNVVGYIYGDRREPELLFNGHIDHVPASDVPNPYSGDVVDGKKYGVTGAVIEGRGASDMKGAVASMVYAGKAILDSGIPIKRTFVMTAVTREEIALGEGIKLVLGEGGVRAKMAVSGEATDLGVHLGHRGKLQYDIRVAGKTSHASNPARGVNPIFKMMDLIGDLREQYRLPSHPALGECTSTIIDIDAGPGRLTPITPGWCEIAFDRRYLPDESASSVQREIEELIARRKAQDPEFTATVELDKDFPPFYCEQTEPIVSIIQEAREAVLGARGEISTWKFGVDGTFIHRAGIPCAGFGPGNERFAHTPEDHVPISDLHASCRVYADIIRRVCC
jgi:succinyl-diaminopimelate desuccinylase